MVFNKNTVQDKALNTIKSWVSKSFKPAQSYKYKLTIELTDHTLDFCIVHTAEHKVMALGTAVCAPQSAADLFLNDAMLNVSDYKNVTIQVCTTNFLIIPEDFYKEKAATDHFKVYFKINNETDLRTEKMRLTQARNLYLLPRHTLQAASNIYQKVTLCHHVSTLVEDLAFFNQTNPHKQCYVNVRHNYIDIVVLQADKLQYANQFEAHTPEDALYYILQTTQMLALKQTEIPVIIMGNVEKEGGLVALLKNYFKKIELIHRTRLLKFDKELDSIAPHSYYTLLAAACV
jgi:hypothetical protein